MGNSVWNRAVSGRADLQARTFDFIEDSCGCSSLPELGDRFRTFMSDLGFEGWFFGRVARSASQLENAYTLAAGDLDRAWTEHYREKGYLRDDRVPRVALRSSAVFSWRQAAEIKPLKASEAIVFTEAREFGHANGVVVPIWTMDGSIWIVSAAWHHGEPSADLLDATSAASHMFASRAISLDVMSRRREAERAGARRLTGRQRDVLMALAGGSSQAEAALSLGISVKRVESLLADARARLEARTTSHLLARALQLQEISLAGATPALGAMSTDGYLAFGRQGRAHLFVR